MKSEDTLQVWDMFLDHVRQRDNISAEIINLLSKAHISKFNETEGVVEIMPGDEMGVHYLKNNLGNSLSEISGYFSKFHSIEKVEINNPEGEKGDGHVFLPQKNERKEVFLGYLNSRYSFESFVVGESNDFANAAALAAARTPGRHNPLFIRGDSGLGKTHLMNAVGNEFAERNPELNVCCLSSEDFTNIVIEHISGRNTAAMRTKLRKKCDLLMIDDIQFIEGKASTLHEFFHTFNALYDAGKQIVITSDRVPGEMVNLGERITSRFMWGLIVDIRPPDIETRAAIIRKKAEEKNVQIPQGVVELISEKVKNNVRELEGVLTKLVIMAQAKGVPIDIRVATEVINERAAHLKGALSNGEGEISAAIIKATVENTFNLKTGQLESQERTKTVSFARQLAMFLIRKHLDMAYVSIGNEFGNRDHSTVIHAVSKIEKGLAQKDEVTISAVRGVEERMRV